VNYPSGAIVNPLSNAPPNQLTLHRYRRINKSYTEELGQGVKLTLMLMPAGEFTMGAPAEEPESEDNERPQRLVKVPQFLMGRYAVTQAQWRVVAGYDRMEQDLDPDPSNFQGDNRPVEQVSWDDAQEFCRRLSAKTGKNYQLPSEAQWEYACRAGMTTAFHFGETITPELANYYTPSSYNGSPTSEAQRGTTDVGSFPANDWGLHDMHGNVLEWCEDDYHPNYEGAPDNGRAWVESDRTETSRLLRGGFWNYAPRNCRSAYRYNASRDGRGILIGFRVCCVPPRLSS
jgi:formylglycine-generating enzyme required for sulfatase activity